MCFTIINKELEMKIKFYTVLDHFYHDLANKVSKIPGSFQGTLKGKLFSYFSRKSLMFGYRAYRLDKDANNKNY